MARKSRKVTAAAVIESTTAESVDNVSAAAVDVSAALIESAAAVDESLSSSTAVALISDAASNNSNDESAADDVSAFLASLRASLDSNVIARIDYETAKGCHDAAVKVARYTRFNFKTRSCDVTDRALAAAAVYGIANFDFINNHRRDGQRFNVYALEKTMAKLYAASTGFFMVDKTADKYCLSILLTLDKNRGRDFTLSSTTIQQMFSLALRDENFARANYESLVRVQPSTASTQCSSSLRALAALRVCEYDESTRRVVNVNHDHALMHMMRAQFNRA